jgi:protein-disulfide isomerase
MNMDRYAVRWTQRALLACFCAVIVACVGLSVIARSAPPDDILSRDSVLRDPEIPSLGNPKGDLTVVEFFDYQCPFCR